MLAFLGNIFITFDVCDYGWYAPISRDFSENESILKQSSIECRKNYSKKVKETLINAFFRICVVTQRLYVKPKKAQ